MVMFVFMGLCVCVFLWDFGCVLVWVFCEEIHEINTNSLGVGGCWELGAYLYRCVSVEKCSYGYVCVCLEERCLYGCVSVCVNVNVRASGVLCLGGGVLVSM